MSLAVLADHMASKGRGPDSMLIHMSPREVQGLQALAMKHGGSLTINPDTGLPEAGFLDKLLPAIIGFAVTATTGLPAWQVGLGIGAEEALRTGDIGRGVSAGFQAYSGGNLGGSMATAGAEAIGAPAAADAYASLGATAITDAEAISQGFGSAEELMQSKAALASQEAATAAGPFGTLSKGAEIASKDPMQYLKANAMPLAGAVGPAILAEMSAKQNMPKTVTKPGMITPYSYFNGQYVAGNPYEVAPTKAAEGGLMGMADGGYSPGMFDFAQRSEPVVRMAEGGIAGYADGGYTQEQINAALKAELAARGGTSQADLTNYAKSQYGLTDAQINAAYDTLPGFNAQGQWDKADYLANHVPGQVDSQMVVNAANAARQADLASNRIGQTVTDASGKVVPLSAWMPGFDASNPTTQTYLGELAAKGGQDSTSQYFNQIATPEQLSANAAAWAKEKARLDALDAAKAPTGLAGLAQNQKPLANTQALIDQSKNALTSQNAGLAALASLPAGASDVDKWFTERGLGLTPIDTSINKFLATYKNELAAMTPKQQEDAMRAALNVEKMNEADVIRATGMTIAQLAAAKRADGSLVVAGDLKDVPIGSLPGGVSGAGNTVINANGTITTRPDIPGIPADGFTGMKDVRDAYTKGGGSLGYTSPTYTAEEFQKKYVDSLRGGTKQAYDYLSGKADYSPIPYTKDGQIAKSYAESVMKMPVASSSKMYIFKDGKFVPNPDYAIPTYDSKGVKSSNLTNADVKAFMDKNPTTDAFYTWATTNNLSPEQIAVASGRPINEISKLYTGAKDLLGEDGKIDPTKVDAATAKDIETNWDEAAYLAAHPDVANELKTGKSITGQPVQFTSGYEHYLKYGKSAGWSPTTKKAAGGGLMAMAARGGAQYDLGDYSDGGRLLRGPGDGVSDSIPASIGNKRPARLADGEFVVPARIVSELGNGSTEAGARKLYAMMDRIQAARGQTVGKGRVAKNSRADKHLPA